MTDITQGQDAAKAPPDVDDLFPKQDVDELFPAGYKPTDQPVRNVSPVQDMIFSNPGRAHARILDAFGYGFADDWGAAAKENTAADEWLRKAGVYNDYAKGQRSIIKSANEVIMRPAVAAVAAAQGAMTGLFHGAQAAVAQAGEEYGFPNLARDIAAMPEAFPAGLHQQAGIPHLPEPIAQAKELNTIGAGEAGYFGTKAVETETPAAVAEATKVQETAKPEPAAPEAPAVPAAQPAAAAPEAAPQPAPDIHAVARQIAPDTFNEFDALAQKKDTFRRWIDDLREVRDQNARDSAPHADEIATLDTQIAEQQAKKGGHGKLQSLIGKRDDLIAERDSYIAERTARDSADMAKVRAQLMETDYRMRDLAGDVSKAYREAEGRIPKAETAEPTLAEPKPTESVAAKPVEYEVTGADLLGDENEVTTVRVLRDKDGNIDGVDDGKSIIKVPPVAKGLPDEQLITRTLGAHTTTGEFHGPSKVVPKQSAMPATVETAPAAATFKTAKGSTYEVHEDGTTTRNKAARSDAGHEGDFGLKPRSAKTIYLDKPELAASLSAAGVHGLGPKGARVAIKDGKAWLLTWNDAAGKWGVSPGSAAIPFSTEPAVGRAPLEVWKPANDVPGYEAYRGMHAGNAITEMNKAPTAAAETLKPEALAKAVNKASEAAGKQAIKPASAPAPEQPEETAPTARLPIAHAPSIVADVSQKLKAAGRPAEEAEAAAQVVAAYWETRAQRFQGAKGTAAEMYAREAPEIKAGKESRKGKARELELAQKGEQFEQAAPNEPRTEAIPEAAGEMLSSYKDDKAIKAHPDYKAAKAGDPEAAARLVAATVDLNTIEAAKQRFGSGAIYAPVVAEEATGHNAIPHLLAAYYADETGGSVSTDIGQINRAFHTGAGPMERLTNPAHFEGNVVPGGRYVIVDDVSVMGSTLASMADHIQKNGGEVVGVATLANASRTGVLRPSRAHVADIERRYGNEVRDLFKTEPAALTADEAQYIRNFKDADALRTAADASEGKRNTRLRAKGIGKTEGGQDLEQVAKGRIRLREDGRATITLMKSADASTFIHETGHEWLDRLLGDADDPDAPADLKADSNTVLKWLGADSPDAVKTRHHEKFARGFETYMMEGRAPSSALARVFAQFKSWLTTIYRTVAALKAPISDDIRAVFDRMLAEKPEKTVIAPEREVHGGIGERHEAMVETTPAGQAHDVANTMEAERDSHAGKNLVGTGENDTRLADTGAEAERRAPGGSKPPGDADASASISGETAASGGTGAVGEGGSEAAGEGTRARKGASERLVTKPTPILNFIASQGGIKATDALISDLRQSLGGNNRYVPGFGQLIRTTKQLSASAKKAGRLEAMSIDRAREAAIEAGLLPEGASITDFMDALDSEVRGLGPSAEGKPTDPAAIAHAEHSFLEGLNDRIKNAGGSELTEKERARALELWHSEGLHDPAEIIERLALEADDEQIAEGAPERAPGVAGWDLPAPGWEAAADERGEPSGTGEGVTGAQPAEPSGGTARTRGEAEGLSPTADLPRSETQLVDKAGNIRLDNLGTPEDVNAVIRSTAAENNDFLAARRNVIPDSEVLALADALGMDAEKLAQRKLGEAFNAEQIVAARKLLIQSATAVRDAAARIAGGTEADVLAYAEAKARHLMIQEQVSGLTAEAGRALRAFRDMGGSKEAADLSAFLKNTQGKTLYQLKEEGALLAMMGTPQQVSKAVAEAKLTRWQKIRGGTLSWFINNLISGPITHAGYSVGNTVVQLFKATVDTSAAAAYGAIRDLPPGERVYFGEVGAQLYGMVRGMRDGIGPAVTALKTGVPFMKGDVNAIAASAEAHARPQTIPGTLGYVMETPSRAVTAIHTIHYGMNYEAEIARRAFRSAMKDGLDPGSGAFNRKIAEFTQSPPEAEMQAAHDEAMKMVLMKSAQFGTAQYHLQKAVNSNILAKIVMPFMQVGANVLHESFIERTPIGLMSPTVRDNLMGKNGAVAQHSQAARISVGIGVSTAVIGLTAEGILTGGGPSDPKQLAVKEMTGWRPYSIRVGETYVPYRKYLGGLGPLIAGTADMYEVGHALNEEGLTKAAASSLFGFAEVVADESWARGLSNFIDAARHWDRDGGRYLRNLAADFIPFSIGMSQVTGLTDPYRHEVRSMLDVARAHIPGLSRGLYPVRDIWGEPIESHTALGPSAANNDRATQALLDAGYYPGRLERKIRGVELSDQQYDDFTRLGGRMAKMRMNALVNMPGFTSMPKQIQTEKIKDIIENARESARSILLMQNPDIIVKANAAKVAKLRGETVH